MQADGDRLFLLHDRSLYVFFCGRLVQHLFLTYANKMWLHGDKLITLQMDDEFCNLCIWTWCNIANLLVRCQKMPSHHIRVDFAGLWQHYMIICSGETGNQAVYDINKACDATELPVIDESNWHITGRAYQVHKTVWTEHFRRVAWIRPQDTVPYFDELTFTWLIGDKILHADETAVSSESIWGYANDLSLKCWSLKNPQLRMPQLFTLSNYLFEREIEKLFFLIWA